MAKQEAAETQRSAEAALPEKKGPVAKLLPWLILVGVVLVFASAGFFVGRLFGARGQTQTASAGEKTPAEDPLKPLDPLEDEDQGWFYELDPVVANLNEPGVTRYARITLTLEITSAWPDLEAKPFLDQRKPLMKHWLTLYLANQTIEDARGQTNLLRMQSAIGDLFNQGLFPNAEPRIKSILFKEFAIQ